MPLAARGSVSTSRVDLASLRSVQEFCKREAEAAEASMATGGGLHSLVLNAGLALMPFKQRSKSLSSVSLVWLA